MNKDEFVRCLNEDLELEFRSVVPYVQHIASVKGAKYQQILIELRDHLTQELNHAQTLADQIDFLGGTPSTRVPSFGEASSSEAALNQDLALESRQLSRFRDRVEQAHELGLPDVAQALSPLLHQTQEHVQDLRAALGY
jgi:bacterioferritin